jgi:hypothetical protein
MRAAHATIFRFVLNGRRGGIEKLAFTMSRECPAAIGQITRKPCFPAGLARESRILLGFA